MSRFSGFLDRTGERLALPRATRRLILTEIAADLDDLFHHYLQQGMSEEEAAARAEEKVDMSDAALAELVRVHSDARGWVNRIGSGVQPFWERFAMAVVVLFFVAAAAVSVDQDALAHLTLSVWQCLAILLLVVVSFAVQLSNLAARPHLRRLREQLATPLFLGAASVVAGLLGAGVQLYLALMRMAAFPRTASRVFSQAVLGCTATVICALLVALVAGIAWFVLAVKVAQLEDAAARSLQREVT